MRFVNVNVAAFDAGKHGGLPVRRRRAGRARAAARCARRAIASTTGWEERAASESRLAAGARSVATAMVRSLGDHAIAPPTQAQVIREINDAAGETGIVVCAAGSAPGDLHKLWRARDPAGKGYHVEYGYSCMGYEIPGGIGRQARRARARGLRAVGDGSYLMLPGELVTAVARADPDRDRARRQPWLRVDRRAVAVGRLVRVRDAATGSPRTASVPVDAGRLDAEVLPLDLAANAESLGARVIRRRDDRASCGTALADARGCRRSGGDLHRGRPLRRACRATRAGGTCRWPRSPSEGTVRAARERLRARPHGAASVSGGSR